MSTFESMIRGRSSVRDAGNGSRFGASAVARRKRERDLDQPSSFFGFIQLFAVILAWYEIVVCYPLNTCWPSPRIAFGESLSALC